jgi:hypothetical protein
MADRVPLVIDVGTQRIVELPTADSLDLTGSNIANVANINSTGKITAVSLQGDGGNLSNIQVANLSGQLADLSIGGGTGTELGDTPLSIEYIWNNTGVDFDGAIFVDITNTNSGGNSKLLDLQTNSVSQFSVLKNGNTAISNVTVTGTANLFNLKLDKFDEIVVSAGNTGAATLTPDANAGSIYKYTLTGNITLNTIANVTTGTSMTVILTQDNVGNRTLTSSMKFAGNVKTLSTAANSIDIMSVFYDGSTYYASLTKGYV